MNRHENIFLKLLDFPQYLCYNQYRKYERTHPEWKKQFTSIVTEQ